MKNCEKLKRKKWKKIIIYKYKYKVVEDNLKGGMG